MTEEYEFAKVLSNKLLENPVYDPDSDICILARQFLRLVEITEWRPIDTAPKDGKPIWLAYYAPGASIPSYVIQAAWGTSTPSHIQCASYSGWFVDPCFIENPPRRGGHAENGIIYRGDKSPTHWFPLPSPPNQVG